MTNTKYKKLVRHILDEGILQAGRNGDTLVIPHYSFTLDFRTSNDLVTLRKMYPKGIFGEFKTLIDPTPLTNVKQFEANGCNYWKQWAENDGSINIDYHNKMHPQLEDIIQQIIDNPESRRHVISLWDHDNIGNLSLPCCWHGMTFSVIDGTLHMTWIQRSVDTMVGLPSDIALASLFMQKVCNETELKMGTCMFSLSNVHVYVEHIDGAKELLTRSTADRNTPLSFVLKS